MIELSFWINAFIPKTVQGYTIDIGSGTHAGKSAIPLPGVARLHPSNLTKPKHAGFLTDQRSFSNQRDASVRMQSFARVSIFGDIVMVAESAHRTSGTVEVDTKSGAELGRAAADLSRCTWSVLLPAAESLYSAGSGLFPTVISANSGGRKSYTLSVKAEASDPLVASSADIDYTGTFRVTVDGTGLTQRVSVKFDGKIDAFPAFEAYASVNSRIAQLFVSAPPQGNTVLNLLGKAKRPVQGSASF